MRGVDQGCPLGERDGCLREIVRIGPTGDCPAGLRQLFASVGGGRLQYAGAVSGARMPSGTEGLANSTARSCAAANVNSRAGVSARFAHSRASRKTCQGRTAAGLCHSRMMLKPSKGSPCASKAGGGTCPRSGRLSRCGCLAGGMGTPKVSGRSDVHSVHNQPQTAWSIQIGKLVRDRAPTERGARFQMPRSMWSPLRPAGEPPARQRRPAPRAGRRYRRCPFKAGSTDRHRPPGSPRGPTASTAARWRLPASLRRRPARTAPRAPGARSAASARSARPPRSGWP